MDESTFEGVADTLFPLDDVNAAMAKVAAGSSKGETVLKA